MPNNSAPLRLSGTNTQHVIEITNIHYLGHGAYTSLINVQSNGFSCEKEFSFDNDEYFINKLREVLTHQTGDAELMGLESDNYLKIQPFGPDTFLISGLIMEAQPLTQSLEFAFTTRYPLIEKFVTEFSEIVRTNT